MLLPHNIAEEFNNKRKNKAKMDNSNTEREKLYEQLKNRRGTIGEIARLGNCSRDWVRLVLKGDYEDTTVLRIASEVLTEKKKTEASTNALIAQAVA